MGSRQSALPTWCQASQPGGAQPSLVAPEGRLVIHHCHCQMGLPRVLAQRRCQGELAGLQVGHSLKQPLQGQASRGEVLEYLQGCAPCSQPVRRLGRPSCPPNRTKWGRQQVTECHRRPLGTDEHFMAKPLTFALVVAMQIVPPLATGKMLEAVHLHWFGCMAMQNLEEVAPGGGPCHVQHTLNESPHLHLQSSSTFLGVMLLPPAKTLLR